MRGGMTRLTADYGTANAKETAYTLNAAGAIVKQTLPSGHYNEFAHDAGGRVTSQYFKDSRGKTVESYVYDYAPSGLPSFTYGYTRTELNGDVYTFVNDRMGRQKQEKKVNSGAVTQYQQDFTYDKNGNRLTMQQSGSGAGIASYSYAYTYDVQGRLTQITDSARNYAATVGTDANGNITSVSEAWTGAPNTWKTDFAFDYENRLTKIELSATSGGKTVKFNTISHAYDGLNRLLKTTAGSNYGHVYDGNKLAGNTNLTTSTDGTAWVNAANAAKPLASTQIQTVGATRYYNVSDERDPVRQVYTDAGTAGDTSQKSRYAEYKLIDGAAPTMVAYGGAIKQSELFRVRNISLNENSIVLPSANGSFEAAAISLNYEGTRVKSALIGRDLNPMGRGDGVYYFAGAISIKVLPALEGNSVYVKGTGNSVNNCGQRGMPFMEYTSLDKVIQLFMNMKRLTGYEVSPWYIPSFIVSEPDEYEKPQLIDSNSKSSKDTWLGSAIPSTKIVESENCTSVINDCMIPYKNLMETYLLQYQNEYERLRVFKDNFEPLVDAFKKANSEYEFYKKYKKDPIGFFESTIPARVLRIAFEIANIASF